MKYEKSRFYGSYLSIYIYVCVGICLYMYVCVYVFECLLVHPFRIWSQTWLHVVSLFTFLVLHAMHSVIALHLGGWGYSWRARFLILKSGDMGERWGVGEGGVLIGGGTKGRGIHSKRIKMLNRTSVTLDGLTPVQNTYLVLPRGRKTWETDTLGPFYYTEATHNEESRHFSLFPYDRDIPNTFLIHSFIYLSQTVWHVQVPRDAGVVVEVVPDKWDYTTVALPPPRVVVSGHRPSPVFLGVPSSFVRFRCLSLRSEVLLDGRSLVQGILLSRTPWLLHL